MKIRTIFAIGITSLILMTGNIQAQEVRISEEQWQESQNFNATEISRNNATMLLSEIEEPTVIETWDISATEEDNVTAALYSNGELVISGTGKMRDFVSGSYVPWKDNLENILVGTIQQGVTNIGDDAFYGCRSLTSITIPEGVTRVGNYAFYYCQSLSNITIPESVTSIGPAFSNCWKLNSITIPEGVTSIEGYTFSFCTGLTSIIIPDGIINIGSRAFYGCRSLGSITIPKDVTSIGDVAFDSCDNLNNIKAYCGSYAEQYVRNNYADKLEIIHIETIDEAVLPTCTETGLTEGSHCSVCGEILVAQEEVAALGHNYTAVVKEPTCTERGYTTHTCNRCNDSYVDSYTEALGHSFGEWIITKEATCKEEGTKERTCTRCHTEKETATIEKIPHKIVIDEAIVPTCTEKGKTEGKHCSVCNTVLVAQEEIPAKGHSFDEWIVTKEATCTEDGNQERQCSICKEKEIKVITKLGHNYESVETAPTCTEQGYATHTCTRCSDHYTDSETEALGHHYIVKSTTEAVCEQGGKIVYECTNCRHSYEETIEAKGHTEVIDNRVEPTCTEKGKTEGKHCSVCNTILVAQEEISALGHHFGEWTIDKEPTYEEEGHKYRTCTNCHTEKQEEVIAKLTKEELQVTTTYPIKEKDSIKYIMLKDGLTVSEVMEEITSNQELKILNKAGKELKATDLVGTGSKVITKAGNQEIYIVAVKGDINGDGKVDFINDVVMLNNYRLKRISLDVANILAGDVDENGVVDFINDIVKINNYRLHRISSL